MYNLERYGYKLDAQTSVWLRADYKGISYSDGDSSENELAAIVKDTTDVSVLSDELPKKCTDWAKLYHLSSTRSNILRPFKHLLDGKVLEIGAGCGAISRYIGECGANLLSLEGSPRRAAIAASRTRGLDNVTVLAEKFDDFKTDERFDVITLIGVLEYASIFSDHEEPAYGMLKRIRSLLKPNGHLLIAIENKLGLKYFAGAPEDHLNAPMYGIENRYKPGEPKTFGKVELEALIIRSGFKSSEFMAPCPDYKLPNSIITERGFLDEDFDASALVWQNVKKDPQLPNITTFNLERAWPGVISNQLGLELANSFLVLAKCQDSSLEPSNILGYHYSTARKSIFCKESTFLKKDNYIAVESKALEPNFIVEQADKNFHYTLPRMDKYISGSTLSKEFLEIAATDNWTVQSFTPFLQKYLARLKEFVAPENPNYTFDDIHHALPSNFIDAVPQNIILEKENRAQLIDLEWSVTDKLELGQVLVRALLILIQNAIPFHPSPTLITKREFIVEALKSIGFNIELESFEGYVASEKRFQEKVTGRPSESFLELDNTIPTLHSKSQYATLYLSDQNGDFSETNTIHVPVSYGKQRVVFSTNQLPAGCRSLRLDPVNSKNSFSILSMSLSSENKLLWDWDRKNVDAIESSGLIFVNSSNGDILGITSNEDPFLIIPTDLHQFNLENLELAVDLDLYTDAKLEAEISLLSMKHSDFVEMKNEITVLQEGAQHAHQENRSISAANGELLKENEAQGLKSARLMQESIDKDAQNSALEILNQKILAENNLLNQELLATRENLDGKISQINDLSGQLESVSNIYARDSLELTAVKINLDTIYSSKSWFITKPIRWAGRAMRGELPKRASDIRGEATRITNPSSSKTCPVKRKNSIAVILPIYRDVEMTERCIRKAMPGVLSVENAFIYAINDCSPDEEMQAMLERLASEYKNTLFIDKNDTNLGFVGTVNRGLSGYVNDDVVLLNSDVMVPNEWLQRLSVEAYKFERIGTVTPFSNNATVCSFPLTLVENDQAFGLDVDTIDSAFKQSDLESVECPTGIGFCMYIRRDCLHEIGYLNTERFGRGYGEENDLCQRAAAAGWVNLLTPNIYAYHEGAVSFSSDKIALIERAMSTLNEMHPNYHADIQSFIIHDPLKPARLIRYTQLLASLPIPKILHVGHRHGGGVVQHIEELVTHYGNSVANLLLTPDSGNTVKFQLRTEQAADSIIFNLPEEFEKLVSLLKAVGVSAVHFHHTMEMNRQVLQIPARLHVPHLVTVHDFYWINGNPTLTNEDGIFKESESEYAVNTLYRLPPNYTPATWRDSWRSLIENAQAVIFPSISTKVYFCSKFEIKDYVIAPHVEPGRDITKAAIAHDFGENVTIGVIGAIGKEKGADLLEALALEAARANLDINFKLIGYAYRALEGVETTGKYASSEISKLIESNRIDILLFPARWPETFSYTLSYGLASQLPIIAPKIGAFPERLSGRDFTTLFEHDQSVDKILFIINKFISTIKNGENPTAPLFEGELTAPDFYNKRYVELISKELGEPNPISTDLLHDLIDGPSTRGITIRKSVLLLICKANSSPRLSALRNSLPLSIRRKIKRLLEGPIHK